MILLGDANGADKMVQDYLATRGYKCVVVYCMQQCRNNIGNWPTKHISAPDGRKDFTYYAAKDLAMARDAKCGIMLWDGRSKGTLNNVQQLLDARKHVLVYLTPDKAFHKLTTNEELAKILERCNPDSIQKAQRQIKTKLAHVEQLSLHVRAPEGG